MFQSYKQKVEGQGVLTSPRNVRRRLKFLGLKNGNPISKPLISARHKKKRLEWALFLSKKVDILLQEDNDSKPRSLVATKWKKDNNVKVLSWPACSPDLNPIENLWKVLKFNIATRKVKTIKGLKRIIKEEWDRLPPDIGEKLVNSMKTRIELVIEAKGDFIFY